MEHLAEKWVPVVMSGAHHKGAFDRIAKAFDRYTSNRRRVSGGLQHLDPFRAGTSLERINTAMREGV
jgi:hypothetical protein